MLPINILILLLFINGTPPVLALLFPNIAKYPLDGNRIFSDGHPILGTHKTIGGFLGGILAGGLVGYLLGFPIIISFAAGFLSMLGDIFFSFIKRRFRLAEGTDLPFFDHVFEGGFPLLLFHRVYSVSWQTTSIILFVFLLIGVGNLIIRKKILSINQTESSRLVRSTSSFREWRACHTALSPFARVLNFESLIYHRFFMQGVFKCMGIYNKGVINALNVQMKSIYISFPDLPEAFNNYRILYMSDLHIDGLDGLAERIAELVAKLRVDICLLGGDYRMEMYGQFSKVKEKLRGLVKQIDAQDGIFGILGNHDCLDIAPDLEDTGIHMLVNDSFTLKKNGESLCLVGVDDPHYYKCNDLGKAFQGVPSNAFAILLAHSPEIIMGTNSRKIDLCLCGHTHGGQIRLPIVGPVITHCRAPRRFSSGLWRYNSMIGYTTNGAGSSGVPVRFNCPPEVVLLTLNKSTNLENTA